MITKLEMYGIGAFVALALATAAWFYAKHEGRVEGRKEVQVLFDEFKNQTAAVALKAEQDKIVKEKEYEKNLTVARTERDTALNRLQVAAARPRGGFVPAPASPAAGDRKICYDRTALDGALRVLDQGVSRLVAEGDTQVINAISLLRAWPNVAKTQ